MAGAAVALLAFVAGPSGAAPANAPARAMIGEARRGGVTVDIAPPIDVFVSGAAAAGRPIVVIDPGHGGRDPGATSVSGDIAEKQLTLVLARELRDRLVKRGRVRVAMTRNSDRYLSLDERAAIARGLGASLFLSLHMDSAPNPLARGASVYSLSDVASDAESARFARMQNAGARPGSADGSVRSMLSDLALRSQMSASADLASRLVRKSSARIALRPAPHRFATFHVLRRAEAPAVLFEAGYISNVDDELLLRSPKYRAALVASLAETIEADVAARSRR
ncbi:MAG: N-acetylmuramoyl-L-alanine amidase [Sphingomonas sp.]|nr:N-acetylmuramoyl-L-alanine amidase [Sphingomonas sp.]